MVENSQTPKDVLQKLSNSKEIEILWKIATLEQAPISALKEMANNPVASDIRIQQALAANQNTPENVLEKMAESTDYRVLLNVINNLNVSTSVLEGVGKNAIIWDDSKIDFQRALAEKPNISDKLIEKLVNSNDRKVLETLYHDNPTVPEQFKEECRRKLRIVPPSVLAPQRRISDSLGRMRAWLKLTPLGAIVACNELEKALRLISTMKNA